MIRRLLPAMCMAIITLGLIGQPAFAQHQQNEGQQAIPTETVTLPLCPVLGRPIDFFDSVRTDNGPVFFCCDDCIKKYKADPEKYADKVAEQRLALAKLAKVQVTCPVSGKPVDPKAFIEQNGQKIFFCCDNCPVTYKQDPAKYKANLANSYSYQTRCPVEGGPINPQVYADLPGGERVYFCCKGCDEKFFKDPAKYLPNLKAQGYRVAPADVTGRGMKEHEEYEHEGHESHGHGG
jgi:YHS domain-containing protein